MGALPPELERRRTQLRELVKRSLAESASDRLQVRAEVSNSVVRGSTGRILDATSPQGQAEEALAREWLASDPAGWNAHRGRLAFGAVLREVPPCTGVLTAYRAVPFSVDAELTVTPRDLGPAPPGKADSRYGLAAAPPLYLSSSLEGVRAEVGGRQLAPGFVQFVQRFVLPANSIRVADFTDANIGMIAQAAFDVCEQLNGEDGHPYGQHLARLVQHHGFDGMRVPGAQGSRQLRYDNIVMFASGNRWQEWLAPGDLPRRFEVGGNSSV